MTVILIILVICLWIHLGWIGVCLAIYAEKKRVTAIHEIIKEIRLRGCEDNKIEVEQELDSYRDDYFKEIEKKIRIELGWTAIYGPICIILVLIYDSFLIFSPIEKIKHNYRKLSEIVQDAYNENKIL